MSVALLTVCDNPDHPGLARLAESLARWGWSTPLATHVVRPWAGTWDKVVGVRDYLPTVRRQGATHVLFVDAFDTVVNGPEEAVRPFVGPGALFSAEAYCWPVASLATRYPPADSRWRYLNSGGYLAEVDYLGDYLLTGEPLTLEQVGGSEGLLREDQTWMSWKFLRDPANCRLDYRCEVFQAFGSGVVTADRPWWETFEFVGGRVRNKVTGTTPLFVHGNGRADMGWLAEG